MTPLAGGDVELVVVEVVVVDVGSVLEVLLVVVVGAVREVVVIGVVVAVAAEDEVLVVTTVEVDLEDEVLVVAMVVVVVSGNDHVTDSLGRLPAVVASLLSNLSRWLDAPSAS